MASASAIPTPAPARDPNGPLARVIGLDRTQRRGRTLVADLGAFAVALAIAEPLMHHLLARHFIGPDLRHDIVDMPPAHT